MVCIPDPHPISRIAGFAGSGGRRENIFFVQAALPGPCRGRCSKSVKMIDSSMNVLSGECR
jgi:hypothetical protein